MGMGMRMMAMRKGKGMICARMEEDEVMGIYRQDGRRE
jgi:hypothetical protein